MAASIASFPLNRPEESLPPLPLLAPPQSASREPEPRSSKVWEVEEVGGVEEEVEVEVVEAAAPADSAALASGSLG